MGSRLSNLRVANPVLTNYAIGYSNAAMVGHHLLPFAYVDKEQGLLPVFDQDAFRVYATERALRAASNRMKPNDNEPKSFTLKEHDLERPIDYRESAESALPLELSAAKTVADAIRLRHEFLVAAMVLNAANYGTGNKIALSSADSFSDPLSDPEGVLEDAKQAIANGVIQDANTLVMGPEMWGNLKKHPKLKAMLADDRPQMLKMQDLKELLEIQNIYVGKARWLPDNSTTSQRVWGNAAVLAYVPDVPDAMPSEGGIVDPANAHDVGVPAFGYTFRKKGSPSVDTYTEQGGKLEVVRATDIFAPYLTGVAAGYLIQDAG